MVDSKATQDGLVAHAKTSSRGDQELYWIGCAEREDNATNRPIMLDWTAHPYPSHLAITRPIPFHPTPSHPVTIMLSRASTGNAVFPSHHVGDKTLANILPKGNE